MYSSILFLSDFNWIWTFLNRLSFKSPVPNFTKICLVRAGVNAANWARRYLLLYSICVYTSIHLCVYVCVCVCVCVYVYTHINTHTHLPTYTYQIYGSDYQVTSLGSDVIYFAAYTHTRFGATCSLFLQKWRTVCLLISYPTTRNMDEKWLVAPF